MAGQALGFFRVARGQQRADSITVVRRGKVRRAKLYYLRNLSGKAAKVKEK